MKVMQVNNKTTNKNNETCITFKVYIVSVNVPRANKLYKSVIIEVTKQTLSIYLSEDVLNASCVLKVFQLVHLREVRYVYRKCNYLP